MFFLIMAWHKHPVIECILIGDAFLIHFILMGFAYSLGLKLFEPKFPIE